MKRIKFAFLAAGLLAGAIAPQAQAEDPVTVAPFERCIEGETNVFGWAVEVCGFMFVSGPVGAVAAVGYCRTRAIRYGNSNPEVVPVATTVRTCQFKRTGGDFGSNLRAAQPGASTVISGLLPQLVSTGTYGVCLEGKALLSNTEEPTRPLSCGNF